MITIVVPTYNNREILTACLHSIIHRTEGVDYRIVVVNQGEALRPPYDSHVQVMNIPTNLGYIKATNIGLSEVKEGEDVLLLNDDCVMIDSMWLKNLSGSLHCDEKRGAVAPRMSNVIGKQNIMYPMTEKKVSVKWLVGACTLIKSEAFQKVGLLDERFGIGMQDDLDYSIRLRREGYSLWIDNTVFVYHIGSTTFKRLYTPNTWALMEHDTRQQLIDKWGMAIVEETLKP